MSRGRCGTITRPAVPGQPGMSLIRSSASSCVPRAAPSDPYPTYARFRRYTSRTSKSYPDRRGHSTFRCPTCCRSSSTRLRVRRNAILRYVISAGFVRVRADASRLGRRRSRDLCGSRPGTLGPRPRGRPRHHRNDNKRRGRSCICDKTRAEERLKRLHVLIRCLDVALHGQSS